MKKILVANRSEIAQRVIRTARDMGIETVVGYADPDVNAPFASMADEAYALGGATYADTYMDGTKLIELAERTGADAVHPGYGFLSESAEFAQAVMDAGLIWIGPSPAVLTALGDKIQARELAERAQVQPVPGISDDELSREQIEEFVARWGYPIVTKRADGGGGRGITIIRTDADLDHFFAANGENPSGIFVEKFVETARHIETQCMRDSHGTFAVVSTRDCSIQRRNQKLIEEAPAAGLTPTQAETVIEASRRLFDSAGFVGLGTCEFLVDTVSGEVFFLEVNPRLQVEHTVSEEVTGLDLVREQLVIADGGHASSVPEASGSSFEFRITCEDPRAGMIPSQGQITELTWPLGHGVRIETGVGLGDTVTADFDSMMAKIIVTGPDRGTAIARSLRALSEFTLEGVATPSDLYMDVISDEAFSGLGYTTRWFEESFLPAWQDANPAVPSESGELGTAEERHSFVVEIDGKLTTLTLPASLISGNGNGAAKPNTPKPQPLRRSRRESTLAGPAHQDDGDVCSPIQAIVVRVAANIGDEVSEGDLLVVLESMKMESYVYAPISGTVTTIEVEDGANVTPGASLLTITPAEADSDETTTKED